MRAQALRMAIMRVSGHLARIETAFGIDERLGWDIRQGKLAGSVFSRAAWRENLLGPWLYVFWLSMVLLNAFPALLLCLNRACH